DERLAVERRERSEDVRNAGGTELRGEAGRSGSTPVRRACLHDVGGCRAGSPDPMDSRVVVLATGLWLDRRGPYTKRMLEQHDQVLAIESGARRCRQTAR